MGFEDLIRGSAWRVYREGLHANRLRTTQSDELGLLGIG
jgi:hypothetical protein